MTDKDELWLKISNTFKQEMSDLNFNTWIAPLKPLYLTNNEFILLSPNRFTKKTIYNKYYDDIQKYLDFISNVKRKVVIIDRYEMDNYKDENIIQNQNIDGQRSILVNEDESEEKYKIENTNPVATQPEQTQDTAEEQTDFSPYGKNLIAKYKFDTFVKGKNNELALAAALAVAQNPATAYNPLFIHGKAGLGKTHLMHAIAHEILKNNPKARVIYTTSESFTNELISSIGDKSTKKNSQFRQKYRNIDVLLIDDIQFIAGKQGTQEEFFHTFNELYNHNKQIILSSDRPPKEIKTLEERLVSRFEWGLMADIQPPDYETRVAIVNEYLDRNNTSLPPEIIDYIAMNVKSNIRELEGAVMNVVGQKTLIGDGNITLDLAKNVLKQLIAETQLRPVTIDLIIECVCDRYNVTLDDLLSKKRSKQIAYPRQIAMYVSRKLLDISLVSIASSFGKDHSTVMHGIKKIESDIKKNSEFDEEIENLINYIQNS